MKLSSGFVSTRLVAAPAVLLALALLGLGRRATAAEIEAQATPEQSFSVTGGLVAATLSANAELQTRWGPVAAVGVGERRGLALNAYVGETVPLHSSGWALRPGFRFLRSWQNVAACPAGCTFDFYVGEIGLRYRGPSGFLFEFAVPLFGWIPVGPDAGETQPHPKLYTIATGELMVVSTVLLGFTFDL
jgi:hypothetical protein